MPTFQLALAIVLLTITSASVTAPVHAQRAPSAVAHDTNACRVDKPASTVIEEDLGHVVTADSVRHPEEGVARARSHLPSVPVDSVIRVSDHRLCAKALSAYRMQRFRADTGWLTSALVYRVRNRYVVYAGEITPLGEITYVFDGTWRFLARR